jgi:hypothetical protein
MTSTAETPVSEGERLLEAAAGAKVELRLTGGVAIAKICPSARHPHLRRTYSDIDLVGRSRSGGAIESFFDQVGYRADEEFNNLHGGHRLFFTDPDRNREADVFLDEVRACHRLDLRHRLDVWPSTLPPADLLLSKLQVVETNEKDFQDIFAILLDHELTEDESGICVPYLVEICSTDWGWWRTVTMVAARSSDRAAQILIDQTERETVQTRLTQILSALESSKKSRKWKMRARIGDRVAWHEDPEEVEHR